VREGFKWLWQLLQHQEDEREGRKHTIDEFKEVVKGAFVCLLSRSFDDGIDAAGGTGSERLVPLLDMLQHSDIPNVSHSVIKDPMKVDCGTVVVTAKTDLTAGDELLNQYRPELDESMPYHRFFTRFGFVPGVQEPIVNLLLDKSSIFFEQAQAAEV
jgi:SET domain-containing protein